jgi:hypothetical protein
LQEEDGPEKRLFSRKGAKPLSAEKFPMEKLYVNEVAPNGEVSTVGLFYSQTEAQKIVDMLRANPERAGYRYEIIEAIRHNLSDKQARPNAPDQKE